MWATEEVPPAVLLVLENLHPLGHTGKLLEGGGVWDEPSGVCTAVRVEMSSGLSFWRKMAITKEINKNVGVP